ncbi:hypothetical protein J7E37_02250 [Bacillus sp. ISL-39]|nr:hypothetical protein [Bacillus sp. ISL-39]
MYSKCGVGAPIPHFLRKGDPLKVTDEAMDIMINFATLVIAVGALGTSSNKKMIYPAIHNV